MLQCGNKQVQNLCGLTQQKFISLKHTIHCGFGDLTRAAILHFHSLRDLVRSLSLHYQEVKVGEGSAGSGTSKLSFVPEVCWPDLVMWLWLTTGQGECNLPICPEEGEN